MDAQASTSGRDFGLEWQISDGLVGYDAAQAAMQARIAAIREGTAGDTVCTSATADGLVDPGRLPAFRTGRGGQWTYHGPGQRIAYVMLDLTRRHGSVGPRDVRAYVQGLEEWLIRALDRFNVHGERRAGRVGIWVADKVSGTEAKIAAIGVRVTRWVSWHGVALNVEPNLSNFAGIIPCGIAEHGVTSLHALGLPVTTADADVALRAAWSEVFS